MKESDVNVVKTCAHEYLDIIGAAIQEVFTDDEIVSLIADAYQYNDTAVEVTRRLKEKPTIIFTTYRCSFIYEGHSSYYRAKEPLCAYDNIREDIEYLFIVLDMAYQRYLEVSD